VNSSIQEMLRLMNGFSSEGIITVFSQNAIDSLETIAQQYSAMVAITILIRAYRTLRDDRTYDVWYSGEYSGYTVTCRLTKNRIFEVWVVK
jgi:hypothetical protein